MKASVIIPLYNKENSILRAINSVLAQTEEDFELIIVNDGSTDKSAAIVQRLAKNKKIRLIMQENTGVSAARNRGVAEANSELVAFLDADDEWLPQFLQTILELRAQFPEGGVFGTAYSIHTMAGETTYPKLAGIFEPEYRGVIEDYLEVLQSILPFNNSSFAATKKALEEIGGFPLEVKFGEDVDTWIRLALRYKVAYANQALAIYHQEAENRACDLYYPYSNEYYPADNLAQLLKDGNVPDRYRQSAIEYVAKHQLGFANIHLYNGNTQKARGLLMSCKGTRIHRWKWFLLYACVFIPPKMLKLLINFKSKFRK